MKGLRRSTASHKAMKTIIGVPKSTITDRPKKRTKETKPSHEG